MLRSLKLTGLDSTVELPSTLSTMSRLAACLWLRSFLLAAPTIDEMSSLVLIAESASSVEKKKKKKE